MVGQEQSVNKLQNLQEELQEKQVTQEEIIQSEELEQPSIDPYFKARLEQIKEKYKNKTKAKQVAGKEEGIVNKTKTRTSKKEDNFLERFLKNKEKVKNKENEKLLSQLEEFLKQPTSEGVNFLIVGKSRVGKSYLIKKLFFGDKKVVSGKYAKDWKKVFYIEEIDLFDTEGKIRNVADGTKNEHISAYPFEMALKTELLIVDDLFFSEYDFVKNQAIYKRLLDYRLEKGLKTIYITNDVRIILHLVNKKEELLEAFGFNDGNINLAIFRVLNRITGDAKISVLKNRKTKTKVKVLTG